MYVVFIINYIRHLINKSKNQTFTYISDRMVYETVQMKEFNEPPPDLVIV